MEDFNPEVQETEAPETAEALEVETPTEEVEAAPAEEVQPEVTEPDPIPEATPNEVPIDAVAQALEEAAKPPISLEALQKRQNLLYKEIKRYLQGRNDLRELAILAEAFAGEGV